MSNKIVTNEKQLIKDIIGYSFPKNNNQRREQIVKIITFALHNLSDLYGVEGKNVVIEMTSC